MKVEMKKLLLSLIFILPSLLYCQDLKVVTEEWKPFNYTDNGELKGISTEVVKAVLDRAGLEGDFKVYPWSRTYYLALNEPDTLIYTIYRNEEREERFHWIGPINKAPRFFFYRLRERDDIDLKSLADAKAYEIGVLNNNYSHQKLLEEGFVEGEHLFVNKTTENNIRMLLAGRIDLFPGNEIATDQLFREMGIEEDRIIKSIQIFDTEARAYMAFNRDSSPELVKRVREAFEEVQSEGLIESVTMKYIPSY